MYKALNTFVDDLFAFVIKMPLMHRLACLRDDVVFLVFFTLIQIYLYQKWIYKEDKRRRNEFGQVGEEAEDDDEEEEKLLKELEELERKDGKLVEKQVKKEVTRKTKESKKNK